MNGADNDSKSKHLYKVDLSQSSQYNSICDDIIASIAFAKNEYSCQAIALAGISSTLS